jgi:hypothetical protein
MNDAKHIDNAHHKFMRKHNYPEALIYEKQKMLTNKYLNEEHTLFKSKSMTAQQIK